MADHRHVALTKPIGSGNVLAYPFIKGNGLRSTDKKKVSRFVFNLINDKYSFTKFY